MPTEITQWLISQGPAGAIILVLVYVIIFLFKKWDEARDELASQMKEFASALTLSTVAIEKANSIAATTIEALRTFERWSNRRSNQ